MNNQSPYTPNSFIMKHFLPLLFALLTTPLWSQTGNGVVILTDASHTFTPTTVDSTTSFSFQLVNEVGVAQTVFFGALDAPFALEDNAPVEIPSQDTIDVTVNFTPTDLGTFTDTLSFVGSVFGSSAFPCWSRLTVAGCCASSSSVVICVERCLAEV